MQILFLLGMIGLLSRRSSIFTSAMRSASVFFPIESKLPEAGRVLSDPGKVADLVRKLLANTTSMQHVPENDRAKQYTEYHVPTFEYINTLLQRHRSKDATKPLFIGVSAPQGCGKTTLTSVICDLFQLEGKRCIAMSLDDFYLPGEQQEQLARTHHDNSLLELRGNAGTHDLHLAMTTLHSLQSLRKASPPTASTSPGSQAPPNTSNTAPKSPQTSQSRSAAKTVTEVLVPRYDKALREGRGDRLPKDQWMVVTEPVDVVLFEGWMLGFNSLPHFDLPVHPNPNRCPSADGSVTTPSAETVQVGTDGADNTAAEKCTFDEEEDAAHLKALTKARNIQEVNELLRPYEALHLFMQAWLLLAVDSPAVVYGWRLQAERQMRDSGRGGMTDEQVADFVDRYMPAYETYLPALYAQGPQRAVARLELLQPLSEGGDVGAHEVVKEVHSGEALCPVLKVTVGNDRLPTKVEFL